MLKLRDGRIAWKEVDGEVLLLDVATSTYFSMNGSASVLWHQLADGTTEVGLVRTLVDEYGIDADQARADVAAFLADCSARGLLAGADSTD